MDHGAVRDFHGMGSRASLIFEYVAQDISAIIRTRVIQMYICPSLSKFYIFVDLPSLQKVEAL